tara:strand:- start:3754 stop:4812 length:1059 start_codon:yes stop_codon:yes gene_type:complete
MSRETVDNAAEWAHNFLAQFGDDPPDEQEVVELDAQEADEAPTQVIPQVAPTVSAVAKAMGGVFPVVYVPSGYIADGQFQTPLYQSGKHNGLPLDRYVIRDDTGQVLGSHSGKYPEREGYQHVYDTLEQLFPESCTGVSVFGHGERVVVEQVLDDPFDLGGGDTIQPFIYTRMSLNGVWKTEIIPIQQRISCENMLGHAGQLIGVKATKNHDNMLTMRAAVLESSMEQTRTMQRMARVLKDQEFTDLQFAQLVSAVFPQPEPDAHHKTVTARNLRVAAVGAAWRAEKEQWNAEVGDRWLAYNAFQGAEQHRISTGYKDTDAAQERSYTRALDGKTPIADMALKYLAGSSLVA